MLRGEFHDGNGLVIPNNITKFGAATILSAAFRNTVPTFWVGLVEGASTPDLLLEDLDEPTIGTNGYGRIQITRDEAGWPIVGELNGEPFIESGWLTWAAVGGNFDKPIQRMVLVNNSNSLTGSVIALSAPLSVARTIGPATLEADRRFKYRVYLR